MAKNLILCPILAQISPPFLQMFFCGIYFCYQLDIALSYYRMQFKRKLKNKTWENSEKPNFGPDFGPNSGPPIFFHGFYLYQVLDIVATYHCTQFKGTIMNQTQENCKKTIWARFWLVWHKLFFHRFYFYQMLDIVGSYHCMQFQGKPIIQTQEDGEKLYFGPVGRKFGAAIFFVFFCFLFFQKFGFVTRYHGRLSSCTISEKTNDLILKNQ